MTDPSPSRSAAGHTDSRSLEFQVSLIRAINEASPDGILVVDDAGIVVSHNRRFLEIWQILPGDAGGAASSYVGKPDQPVLQSVVAQVRAPEAFAQRVQALYADPRQDDDCEIELLDGRTLERHSTGLFGENGRFFGRVWFFRDISQHKAIEAQLHQFAESDALTGVANRRLFFQRAVLEIARARRARRPLSVVSLDIDHFKRINDSHGHAAGDEVLKALCRDCSALLRQVDLFARIGGEEFAVLLPETAMAEAHRTTERLRQSLARQVVTFDGRQISFTVSAGVAALRAGDVTIDDCMRRADEALYRAKNGGRNRVEDEA
jgi:diguanylate cyclase (GGDEF)-like protein